MDALQTKSTNEAPPARYRLNRRAALLLSVVFLVLSGLGATLCMYRLQPQRRVGNLRENVENSLATGQYRRAAIELGNLVRLTPTDADAWLKFARIQLQILGESNDSASSRAPIDTGRERLRLAIHAYRRAAELDPNQLEAQRWLLELNLRGGNWTDARQRLAAVQQLAPNDPMVALAWEMLPTEFYAEAANAAKFLESGQPRDAAEIVKSPLAQRPADLDLLQIFAQATTLLQRTEQRDSALEAARKIVGASAKLDLIAARCLWLEGKFDQADSLAEKAARTPHVELAARRLRTDILKTQAQTDLGHANVYWNRAVAQCRAILDRSPVDQEAANAAAWMLGVQLGRWAEALELTTAMLAGLERPDAFLLDTHGWLLARIGRKFEAVDVLKRATRQNPHDSEIRLHLSIAESMARKPSSDGAVWPLLERNASRVNLNLYSESLLPDSLAPAVATGVDGFDGLEVRLVRSKRGQQ